jgi:hypothetical protein
MAQAAPDPVPGDAGHLARQRQRHVADLVEEEGAAVALLKLADAAAVRPGEGTLLVPEQLGFEQVLRDGGAVKEEKRCLGPGAVLVDGAGDQFLGGAAPDGSTRESWRPLTCVSPLTGGTREQSCQRSLY